VLGLLLRVAWLTAWVVALPWLVARRLFARAPRGSYLRVEIDGAIDEAPPPPRLWPPGATRPFSIHGLKALVDEVARDSRVRGLVVVLHHVRGGFATATSLRQVLALARLAGKQVVVHLPQGGGTKEAFVGVAADRLLLGPGATLAPVGLLASTRYLRGALDRAGIVPDVHAQGRFKTAGEQLERSSMSDAQREQLDAVLDRVHAEVIGAISSGRRVDESRARALVDGAPYTGLEAVEAGMADGVAYEDEVPTRLSAEPGKSVVRPADAYLKARTSLRPAALRARGVIAVVRVHGAITGGPGLPLASVAVDDRVIGSIRLARAHPRIRGVVLHVSSPGGSALASDRIHHELVQLAAEKPLVACMGDVAASGGYYVSVAAHEIVAQPTTVTGSIGVVAARLVIEPLLARFGVVTEVLHRGANARLLDPLLPLGEGDRRALERELERTYRAFVGVVATGRKRPTEEIEALAQGRVWIGADAHARGLVDRLGGFEDALEAVRSRVGRGADRLRVVVLRPPRAPFPVLDPPERKAARGMAELAGLVADALGVDASLLALRGERVLAWAGDVTLSA
jgi:protease-4